MRVSAGLLPLGQKARKRGTAVTAVGPAGRMPVPRLQLTASQPDGTNSQSGAPLRMTALNVTTGTSSQTTDRPTNGETKTELWNAESCFG